MGSQFVSERLEGTTATVSAMPVAFPTVGHPPKHDDHVGDEKRSKDDKKQKKKKKKKKNKDKKTGKKVHKERFQQ